LTNSGTGTFAAKVDYPTGSSPYSVAIGDLNGDGKADLAVTNLNSTTVSVLINNVTSMFFAQVSTGHIGIGTPNPILGPLQMASGAFVTTGGVWTNASDKNLKENFTELNGQEVLEKITKLSVTQWNYKNEPQTIKHIGPLAQDFYAIFGLGGFDTSISTIDPAGVAIFGIQELTRIIQDQQLLLNGKEGQLLDDSTTATSIIASIQTETIRNAIDTISLRLSEKNKVLTDFVSARVTAIRGYFDEIFVNRSHQKELCVGENGNETCITKSQLDNLISGSQNNISSTPVSSGSTTPTTTDQSITTITTPPSVTTSTTEIITTTPTAIVTDPITNQVIDPTPITTQTEATTTTPVSTSEPIITSTSTATDPSTIQVVEPSTTTTP